MITWDDGQTMCQNLSSDSTSAQLTIFKQMMNVGYKLCLAELGRTVTERTTTDTELVTDDNVQEYFLPKDCLFPKSVVIQKSTSDKRPVTECESQEEWDLLNTNNTTADVPDVYFVKPNWGVGGTKILFYPTPAVADYIIRVVFEVIDKDLSADVYATGTVTFTNGDATILGNGTTFTAAMVGRYIYCSVDGYWYKIASYTSATSIEIERNWVGTTTAGLTTNIRELFGLPEEMQILPIYFALAHYFAIKKDTTQETKYWTLYNAGVAAGQRRWGTKTRSNISRTALKGSRFPMWAPSNFPSSATANP